MTELITEAFWLLWFSSIGLARVISRDSLMSLVAGIGLLLESIYLSGIIPVDSFNMWGVVLMALVGAYLMVAGWNGS